MAIARHPARNVQVWYAVVTYQTSGGKFARFSCTQMILRPKGCSAAAGLGRSARRRSRSISAAALKSRASHLPRQTE